jgi:general secretion pathway protein J
MRSNRCTEGATVAASQRGFTLLEVLVSITLRAVLLAAALAGIRTATRAANAGSLAADRTNKLRVTQEFLRRELMQALSTPFEQEQTTGKTRVFLGEAEKLVFVAPMPGYLGKGGPYVQQVSIARGPHGNQMEFRHALLNGYRDEKAKKVDEGEPVVLMENIRGATFEYRGLSDTGQVTDWEDSWDRYGAAPMMVRIKVEFEPEAHQTWPEMVVPLMLDPLAAQRALEPQFGPTGN